MPDGNGSPLGRARGADDLGSASLEFAYVCVWEFLNTGTSSSAQLQLISVLVFASLVE